MARVLDDILKDMTWPYGIDFFFHYESHSEIPSVNPNKTFILDQSHTRVCGILLFFVRDGACLCKSNHRTHELGFTAHKKFWKSHSDLIVWHKKIIICLLNANCCFLVWAWDFFFSFQCVIYSALPSNTRMSIFRKIALSARKIFKYVAENERRV